MQDKRITDRRGGERRHFRRSVVSAFRNRDYWQDLILYQWPSLALFLALAGVLVFHLFFQK
jgi:hypothetical protein